MILTAYLPAGRKQLYYLIYERDRRSHNLEHAQLGTFLKSWRCECPWIVIPSLCEWLKLQIDQTPRSDDADPRSPPPGSPTPQDDADELVIATFAPTADVLIR